MTCRETENDRIGPVDWRAIDLVVFDVDGTLYDQRALRLRMMRDVLVHAASERGLRTVRVLRTYRWLRERLAREEAADFERLLVAATASYEDCSEALVGSIVAEWIEHRPLRYLPVCRYAGVPELFVSLRRAGKTIGILSDYPAREKLIALGLEAEVVVCATDEGVGRLKPHPRGLEVLMARAGAAATRTLLIGDRVACDGFAARRAGARCLIRSRKPRDGWTTFDRYDAGLFAAVMTDR